ncbi:MAG TPA: DUF5808 domain-containing protein [Vicinamibacterales bacterium]|jgi:uncharacterized membrane protein|nr:DUF5808 domain-containing protein [Vicinamibacterales bacterium]
MKGVPPTGVTKWAVRAMTLIILGTAGFLMAGYDSLPDLLPVKFKAGGVPDGWQYRTPTRVLLPVFVEFALALTLGAVGALLLSRPHGEHDPDAPDVRAAAAASEAVFLIALIWVAFQGYAAWLLNWMWMHERAAPGLFYNYFELTAVVLTVIVAIRANLRVGRPAPRPFVAAHWRYGQLYKNPDDPALFVPTRDGRRWTLNFGRPVTAALLGLILAVGIVGPTVILAAFLRTR